MSKKIKSFEDWKQETSESNGHKLASFDKFVNEDHDEDFEDEDDHENDEDDEDEGELDFSEIEWKLDKFMPEDEDVQKEYYEILDDETTSPEEKAKELEDFFNNYADEDRLNDYLGKDRSIADFAAYLAKGRDKSVNEDHNENDQIILIDEFINDPSKEADRIDAMAENWTEEERNYLKSFVIGERGDEQEAFDVTEYTAIKGEDTVFKTKDGYGVLTPEQLIEFVHGTSLKDAIEWLNNSWDWDLIVLD